MTCERSCGVGCPLIKSRGVVAGAVMSNFFSRRTHKKATGEGSRGGVPLNKSRGGSHATTRCRSGGSDRGTGGEAGRVTWVVML